MYGSRCLSTLISCSPLVDANVMCQNGGNATNKSKLRNNWSRRKSKTGKNWPTDQNVRLIHYTPLKYRLGGHFTFILGYELCSLLEALLWLRYRIAIKALSHCFCFCLSLQLNSLPCSFTPISPYPFLLYSLIQSMSTIELNLKKKKKYLTHAIPTTWGESWSWLYGSWIYLYLCNQWHHQ